MNPIQSYQAVIDDFAQSTVLICMKESLPKGGIQFGENDRDAMDSCVRNYLRAYMISGAVWTEAIGSLTEGYNNQIRSAED
jgi:hypothetical protein